MKLMRLMGLTACVLSLVGCAAKDQGWMDSPLKDTSWQLVTIQSNNSDRGREYVASMAEIVMTLKASNEASFKIGCQAGVSDWRIYPSMVNTKGEINFEEMEIAASSCPPNLLVNRFLRDFEFFQDYVLIQNHLYISTQANEATYGWRKVQTAQ